jgi:hypothetical protein
MYRSLNGRNIVTLLLAALLEHKIVLKSSKITALTGVICLCPSCLRVALSRLERGHSYWGVFTVSAGAFAVDALIRAFATKGTQHSPYCILTQM